MPNTFDARIAHYEALLEQIKKLHDLESTSQFIDIDLTQSESVLLEHLEALRLGKALTKDGVLDIDKHLAATRHRLRMLEVLQQLQRRDSSLEGIS